MDLRSSQELRMLKTTNQFLLNNQSSYAAVAALGRYQLALEGKITVIETVDQGRETITGGVSDVKRDIRNKLVNAIYTVQAPFCAYAADKGKLELVAIYSKNETEVFRMKDSDLVGFGMQFHQVLVPLTAEVEEYGIAAADIAKISTLGIAYNSMIGELGSSVAESMTATQKVDAFIDDAKLFLREKVDKMVDGFKEKNPDFYNGYYAARRIIDVGIRHEPQQEEPPVPTPTPNNS